MRIMTDNTIYPLAAIRAMALHTQGLTRPVADDTTTTQADIIAAANQIGAVQIDTLQMVHRSHYLTLWSRLGNYDVADFDAVMYGAERQFFEYWLKAVCYIPLEDYRYRLPLMRKLRENPRYWHGWLNNDEHRALAAHVKQRIHDEGGLRTSDFKSDGKKRGAWWDWKPAKAALEYLYDVGELMIADRIKFQRVYDLTERVLPDGVDTDEVSREEMIRYYIEKGARKFGICDAMQTIDIVHDIKRTEAKPHIKALIDEGILVEVQAEQFDGEAVTMVVHRDHLSLLQRAADGNITTGRTTFLNFFDNLLWPRGRDMAWWNFRHILEAYKPAAQREWGYYCLTILHGDRLVGRFDPKLERKSGTLRLKALYLEPGVKASDELVASVAVAMRDFMAFHSATDLIIEKSEPKVFGKKLIKML